MKLKVLEDNNTFIDMYYLGEPAVSYYIEDGEDKILFDVGYSDAFLVNAEKMNIDIDNISKVVISHGMAEHPIRYNLLASFLNANNIEVYAIYHIGHGKYASKVGHMAKGEFDQCVTNIY